FGHQPQVAQWNLIRLANAVAAVFESPDPLYAGLEHYATVFGETNRRMIAQKLGFAEGQPEDVRFMAELHTLLESGEVDMTLFFRALAEIDVDAPDLALFEHCFYDAAKREAAAPALKDWLARYAVRLRQDGRPAAERRAAMN